MSGRMEVGFLLGVEGKAEREGPGEAGDGA